MFHGTDPDPNRIHWYLYSGLERDLEAGEHAERGEGFVEALARLRLQRLGKLAEFLKSK